MRRLLVTLALAAAAVPMLAGVAGLPRPGDPSAPIHRHVAAHYLEEGGRETGADNRVTAVLLGYRAFDTFGEVMVIFAALAAVMAVLSPVSPSSPKRSSPRAVQPVPISPVVAYIFRLTAPLIAAFGIYVILKGHVAPGGGFQGGVILGALLVLLSVVLGREPDRPLLAPRLARWLQSAAPIAFLIAASAGLALTGALLGLPADPGWLRHFMMLGLEIGIGVGGGAIILGLFQLLRGD
jgi:multicomponent Na+:H+ antiporter subunit B